jgi:hypothetical protein
VLGSLIERTRGTGDGWTIVLADLGGEPDAWATIQPSMDRSINVQRLLEATA